MKRIKIHLLLLIFTSFLTSNLLPTEHKFIPHQVANFDQILLKRRKEFDFDSKKTPSKVLQDQGVSVSKLQTKDRSEEHRIYNANYGIYDGPVVSQNSEQQIMIGDSLVNRLQFSPNKSSIVCACSDRLYIFEQKIFSSPYDDTFFLIGDHPLIAKDTTLHIFGKARPKELEMCNYSKNQVIYAHDKSLNLLDVRLSDGKRHERSLFNFSSAITQISCCGFDTDGEKYIITGHANGNVIISQLDDLNLNIIKTIRHATGISCVETTPDKNYIIVQTLPSQMNGMQEEATTFAYATPDFVKKLKNIIPKIEQIQSDAHKESQSTIGANVKVYKQLSGKVAGIYLDQIEEGYKAKIAAINNIKDQIEEMDGLVFNEFSRILVDCLGEKIKPFLNEQSNQELLNKNKIDLHAKHSEFIAMLIQIKSKIMKVVKSQKIQQKLDFLFLKIEEPSNNTIKLINQQNWLCNLGLVAFPIICASIVCYLIYNTKLTS